MDEAELVREAARGDLAAFEALFLKYKAHAFAIAVLILCSTDEAADVVQDAFLTALEELPKLRDPEAFACWLTTIVRRKALRLRRLHARTPDMYLAEELIDGLPSLWDRRTSFRGALAAEAQELVRKSLDELPDHLSRVLNLKYEQDLSYEKIAAALSVPVSTIKARLYAARRALAPKLAGLRGLEDLDLGGLPMGAEQTLYPCPAIRITDSEAAGEAVTLKESPFHYLEMKEGATSEVVMFRYWDPSTDWAPGHRGASQVRVVRRVVGPAVVEEEDCWEVESRIRYPDGHVEEASRTYVGLTDEGFVTYLNTWREGDVRHVRSRLMRTNGVALPDWPPELSLSPPEDAPFGVRRSIERWTTVQINSHSLHCLEVICGLRGRGHVRRYIAEDGTVALFLRYNPQRLWADPPDVQPLEAEYSGETHFAEWSVVPRRLLEAPGPTLT